jgi:hypothetical protein
MCSHRRYRGVVTSGGDAFDPGPDAARSADDVDDVDDVDDIEDVEDRADEDVWFDEEDPEVAEAEAPPRFDSWRKRSATGAILTGFALGLQQVFEKNPDEPAIVMQTSGDPPKDLPVEAEVEQGRPRRSVVNIRPWLLDTPRHADKDEDKDKAKDTDSPPDSTPTSGGGGPRTG